MSINIASRHKVFLLAAAGILGTGCSTAPSIGDKPFISYVDSPRMDGLEDRLLRLTEGAFPGNKYAEADVFISTGESRYWDTRIEGISTSDRKADAVIARAELPGDFLRDVVSYGNENPVVTNEDACVGGHYETVSRYPLVGRQGPRSEWVCRDYQKIETSRQAIRSVHLRFAVIPLGESQKKMAQIVIKFPVGGDAYFELNNGAFVPSPWKTAIQSVVDAPVRVEASNQLTPTAAVP